MLGNAQRTELDKLIQSIVNHDNVRVEFYAMDHRPRTREWGTGHAICFQSFECYPEGDYKFGFRVHIANVGSEDGIGPKVKELTGYLMHNGVAREKIKAKRVRGKFL